MHSRVKTVRAFRLVVTLKGCHEMGRSRTNGVRLLAASAVACLRTLEGHTNVVWAVAVRAVGRIVGWSGPVDDPAWGV